MGEKAILVITIGFGALGWVFTHVVDRVTNSPTVEYRISESTSGESKLLVIRLVNVTRSTSFGTVRLLLTVPAGGWIKDVEVIPVEPSCEGDIPPREYGRSANITLERFMPGARYEIHARYSAIRRPALRASAIDTPIRLQKRGLETLFARYEVQALIALAALWALVLAATLAVAGRSKGAAANATGPQS